MHGFQTDTADDYYYYRHCRAGKADSYGFFFAFFFKQLSSSLFITKKTQTSYGAFLVRTDYFTFHHTPDSDDLVRLE